LRCPFCGFLESKVVDSRPTDEGSSIRRRRECLSESCQKRFTTYENVESQPLFVIKRNGSVQAFDRGKLMRSIAAACDKRHVSLDQIEAAVSEIEQQLQGTMERQVPSDRIGEMVMEQLRELDEVAYVRFASVYRQFTDVATFLTEVERLIRNRP
jgi:transcriptional repressor NrdR